MFFNVYKAFWCETFVWLNRMVRTQMEVEMEVPNTEGEVEPVVTIEEEEDVVLFWDNGRKSKSVRELAAGAIDGNKEDQSILSYYR